MAAKATKATKRKKPTTTLSILIPVYNEYSYVREALRRVLEAPLPDGVARELIVVDDGSMDGTREILAELDEEHEDITLILHERNQGKGAAIRTCIAAMSGDLAVFQDADLEYDPSDLAKVIQPILNGMADVVYGSRFCACPERRVLFYRHELGNRFLTFLSNLLTDLNLTDMETCYKAFRTSILRSIPIRSNCFGIEPEITAKVAKRNCIVYEVPISYHGRTYEEGKKITWKDGFRALFTICKFSLLDDCYEEQHGRRMLRGIKNSHSFSRYIGSLARPHCGRKVLELSAGLGAMSRQLCGNRTLLSSEKDPAFLDLLRNQFSGREDVEVVELDVAAENGLDGLEGREIDTVVAFNAMETMEDDQGLVDRAHRLLPYGGRLILQVPQYQGLLSSLDEELGHLRRYDKIALSAMLTRAGFEVILLKELNCPGLIVWYLQGVLRGKKRLGKLTRKLLDWMVPLMRLFAWVPAPGASLFLVARKR
ncbi:MAG: glycosyltransferase [Planctomycetota bacterium]|jgi:glycosyltransferase involved in cell wall biosynthesis